MCLCECAVCGSGAKVPLYHHQFNTPQTHSPSPFSLHNNFGGGFADDADRVALTSMKFASTESAGATCQGVGGAMTPPSTAAAASTSRLMENGGDDVCVPLPPWAVRAGAREVIYFDPAQTTAAIVTCGGLCPGLNDVVQGLVVKLSNYGVPKGNILGVRGGLRGFYDKDRKPIPLTKADVDGIQLQGGTILGTSRGGADIPSIVRRLAVDAIDMCFVVGGNGGNAAAAAIAAECEARNVTCSVVGVPKSIDNDVLLVDRCFGFETAVQEAQRALQAAKVEAASAYRGVGLVKLMGRQSGFLCVLGGGGGRGEGGLRRALLLARSLSPTRPGLSHTVSLSPLSRRHTLFYFPSAPCKPPWRPASSTSASFRRSGSLWRAGAGWRPSSRAC